MKNVKDVGERLFLSETWHNDVWRLSQIATFKFFKVRGWKNVQTIHNALYSVDHTSEAEAGCLKINK